MKRLGVIPLAIVLLLGTMGVGYAKWSDNAALTANVSSDSLSATVSEPTGTWVYKLASGGIVIQQDNGWASSRPAPPASTAPGVPAPLGYAEITSPVLPVTSNGSGVTLNVKYYNMFPAPVPGGQFLLWKTDFKLTNAGSVPFKVDVFPTTQPPAGLGYITIVRAYKLADGSWANPNPPDLNGYQVEPGESIYVWIGFTVTEDTQQSVTGTFTATLTLIQWNEFSS